MAKSTILESMPAKLGAAARRSGMPISPGWRRNERKRLWTATPPLESGDSAPRLERFERHSI
jgi:hypothetical protein